MQYYQWKQIMIIKLLLILGIERRKNMEKLSKEYLISQYNIAVADFKLASNEDAQWDARKRMAKLEALAIEMHGEEFAQELNNLIKI